MSEAILYNATEQDFKTNGIGVLTDAISWTVTEEINGEYELEMEYPINGIHAEDIGLFKILHAAHNVTGVREPFRIYNIAQTLDKTFIVNARHISYDMNGFIFSRFPYICEIYQGRHSVLNPLPSNFNGYSISAILAQMQASISGVYGQTRPFSVTADKSGARMLNGGEAVYQSCKWFFFGRENSLVDIYGGEFSFSGLSTTWHKNGRGSANGVKLLYGKNLTGLEIEVSSADSYSDIAPYYPSGKNIVGSIIPPDENNPLPIRRTLGLDMTSYFEGTGTKPTLVQVTLRGNALKESLGVNSTMSQKIKVSGATLLEKDNVVLGDRVNVIAPRLGINAETRLRKATWNGKAEKYDSAEFGEVTNRYNVASVDRLATGSKDYALTDDQIQAAMDAAT